MTTQWPPLKIAVACRQAPGPAHGARQDIDTAGSCIDLVATATNPVELWLGQPPVCPVAALSRQAAAIWSPLAHWLHHANFGCYW